MLSRRIPASYQITLTGVVGWVGDRARRTGPVAGGAPTRSAASPARSIRSSSSCVRDEGVHSADRVGAPPAPPVRRTLPESPGRPKRRSATPVAL